MTTKHITLTSLSITLLLAFGASPLAAKPNVLFLFTDDQRADTIHALGNDLIQTPNLDSLVKSGFTFNNAYCLGSNSGAVCVASRNMLMSGRAYFRWDPEGNGKQRYASAEKANFPDAMKAAGYETWHYGKKGNTAVEIHKRFDHTRYLDNDNEARALGEPGRDITAAAIDFISSRPKAKPFFMYCAFSVPHDPRGANEKYLELYQRDQIPLPANYLPLHPFNNGEQLVRDELLADFPRSKAEIKKHLHDYYAVISGFDGYTGKILKALRESGQFENTIIIFSSDHGLALGSHGLMGKQSLYEHSMKSPLIFSGPGIPHGQSDALVYLLDIFPSTLDLVGTPVPDGLDGLSFAPVIRGDEKQTRPWLGTSYKKVMRSIRNDRWKMIRYPHINRTQLFDLKNDPDETTDLSKDPNQADRLQAMAKQLEKWQKQYGDTLPLSSDSPEDPTFNPDLETIKAAKAKWGKGRKKKGKKTKK